MSISSAESELKRARTTLEDARKKQAAEEKKVASAQKDAASKEQSASRTNSTSLAKSNLDGAKRKRDEANKARSKAAEFSTKAAKAQADVHKAQTKLDKARADETKKQDAAAWSARSKQEREQRRAAQREASAQAQRDAEVAALGADVAETRAVLSSRPWETPPPEKVTVLFLSAEPTGQDRLRIDREIRQVQQQVRSSELRDAMEFHIRPAARFTDLLQHLNEVEPDVVHFSGHGHNAGLALHDDHDQTHDLTAEQLGRLLSLAPNPLKLVVLNACNSAQLAEVAAQHAVGAVGMEQSIGDDSARLFAGQLYNSLGFGRTLGLAFEQAKFQVDASLDHWPGDAVLVMTEGADPNSYVVVSPPRG